MAGDLALFREVAPSSRQGGAMRITNAQIGLSYPERRDKQHHNNHQIRREVERRYQETSTTPLGLLRM